ncbi:hypothetical protein FOA52_014521 [Chlamydomonas sp. UWO 241]|nr:hypothetical protein FOA52_014521 [Chlamydomonas sp. UWO 241]
MLCAGVDHDPGNGNSHAGHPHPDHGYRRKGTLGSSDVSYAASLANSALTVGFMDAIEMMDLQPGQFITVTVSDFCDRGSLADVVGQPADGSGGPGPGPGGSGVFGSAFTSRTTLRAMLRTAREVAQGLCYLHSMGITHGALKPHNVLLKSVQLDRRGCTVRLSDFGYKSEALGGCWLGALS